MKYGIMFRHGGSTYLVHRITKQNHPSAAIPFGLNHTLFHRRHGSLHTTIIQILERIIPSDLEMAVLGDGLLAVLVGVL